jgi:hypothetical protein
MDGQLLEKKDCSSAVKAAIPEAKALAEVSSSEWDSPPPVKTGKGVSTDGNSVS